jgi:3-oxoacyl-[acyl-carrier-protein] synthase II
VAALVDALRGDARGFRVFDRVPDSPWMKSRLAAVAREIRSDAPDPWPEAVRLAVEVAAEAVADARLDAAIDAGATRTAIVNGTMHGSEADLEFTRQRLAGDPDPRLHGETAAATALRIARRVGARGPRLTVSTACSSGLNAIGQAARLVACGEIDRAVAGGNDMVNVLTHVGFNSLGALSPGGCRPLDVARDGITLGDGAAYVVLEREDDALRRNAPVRGVVAGYAYAGEGYHPTASDPEGACAVRTLTAALSEDASPRDLAWVAAHATGTPANDEAEVRAVQRVVAHLGIEGPVDVCALKSHLGHTLGAAGALETVAVLACMMHAFVPGTAGLARPVPHAPPLRIGPSAQPRRIPLALCSSFGFGGSVAALALRAPDASPRA